MRVFERLGTLTRGLAIRIVCLLRRRPLIIVHIQEPGLREHVEPVVAWLLSHAAVEVLVLVPSSRLSDYRATTSLPVRAASLWIAHEHAVDVQACRPRVLLSIHPETPSEIAAQLASSGCCRAVMQHGLSDKAAFCDVHTPDPLAHTDVVLLAGSVFRDGSLRDYQTRHAESYRRLRILETGLPKTDLLFQPTFDRVQVLRGLGLDPSRKTVCYAPTFQKTASLQTAGVEIIQALAGLDVNVIVKLHHWSLKDLNAEPWAARETDGKDWKHILRTLEQQHPNVRLAAPGDAAPYLCASDVLVSDASGAAYEFLILDRPLVFFDVPALFEEFGVEGIHYWGRECGTVVRTTCELAAAVRSGLAQPALQQEQRARLLDRLLYAPGQSTPTTGRALMDLVLDPARSQ